MLKYDKKKFALTCPGPPSPLIYAHEVKNSERAPSNTCNNSWWLACIIRIICIIISTISSSSCRIAQLCYMQTTKTNISIVQPSQLHLITLPSVIVGGGGCYDTKYRLLWWVIIVTLCTVRRRRATVPDPVYTVPLQLQATYTCSPNTDDLLAVSTHYTTMNHFTRQRNLAIVSRRLFCYGPSVVRL